MRDKDESDRNPSGRFSGNWKENVDTKLMVEMYDSGAYSQQEIGSILGICQSAVSNRISRYKRKERGYY